jgi:murein DD-endopeptidase MepM/ murein hydrolase activator NlpD
VSGSRGIRLALASVAAAAILFAPLVPTSVRAQDSLEAEKRAELERIQEEARRHRETASKLRGQEQKAMVQLRRTDRQLTTTRRRLQALQQRQHVLDRQMTVTRANLERSIASLSDQRARLRLRLRNLYKYGTGRELEFLLSTRSFAQLLARWDFLVMVAEQDRVMLEGIQSEKEQVEANRERLELNLGEVQRNTSRTTRENKKLSSLRAERSSTVRSIQMQRETYEAAAAELEKTARAIKNLLASLERKRRETVGRAPQPFTGNFEAGKGRLDWPVRGSLVGRYGRETHPRWGTLTMNNGIDIETAIGTPVRAVAKGRVDYVSEDFGTYGQMIILNHGDGYYTLYGHLSQLGVSVGQEIASGATIGASGDTGSLKGPILHFEVRKGGTSLDPEMWLR